ncbi:peptidyl-glycine alpha-amidating monooxygenase isoform 5-T8 [Liasis olivaceus]
MNSRVDMAGLVNNLLILFLIFQNSCLAFRSPLSVFKRYKDATRSHSSECLGSNRQLVPLGLSEFALDIRMPGVTPKQSDTYLCMSLRLPVEEEAYVVDFKPHASMDTVHHMLLFGCNNPASDDDYWDCDGETCMDTSDILYAWARNAPPTRLPKGVGFKVGGEMGSKYFVLQVHYGDVSAFKDKHKDCSGVTLHLTNQKQPLIAGMYLMMSMDTVIPPGEKVVNADIACHYKMYPMHPFAYRVHTHHLGKVVSGYRVRDGQWTPIGRQSPQLPQAFYPVENPVEIKYGDILAARCVFTGEGRSSETYIGGTARDEMCNFYIMYYMEAKYAVSSMTCTQNINPEMFKSIPQEANIPIPVKPDMTMIAHGHNEEIKNEDTGTIIQQPKREEEEVLDQGLNIEEVADWPGINLRLGQVSGLALDPNNNLVIFHRGNHVWDANSFNSSYVYQQKGLGPIKESTILVLEASSSAILHSTGKNMFYLPHGLSIDNNGNYWVTDVALHQVFKLASNGAESPLLTLGRALQPGSDKYHFCQPTDVAVDPASGNIYVSDGYCNSRIVQFSPNGIFVMQWGEETSVGQAKPAQFNIPHSLTLVSEFGQLCVADRENGRIQCFKPETGEFVREIRHPLFGREVFAVSYAPGGLLYAVNGKPYPGDREPVQAFVMNFSTGEIIDTFIPLRKNFEMPHDIVASEGRTVYVGDAHANTVWKFTSTEKMEHRSVKKAGIEIQEIKADADHKFDSSSGRILGRFRGKGSGGLNLGNFFASRAGYSRKGFDRLSTEGSDQEKEEDATDSEEEDPIPQPPAIPSSSS